MNSPLINSLVTFAALSNSKIDDSLVRSDTEMEDSVAKEDNMRDNRRKENSDRFIVEEDGETVSFAAFLLNKLIGAPDNTENECENYVKKHIAEMMDRQKQYMHSAELTAPTAPASPLAGALVYKMDNDPCSWQYPAKPLLVSMVWRETCLNEETLSKVQVREITLGRTSEENIQEFASYIKRKIKEAKDSYPVEIVTCHVGYIRISQSDLAKFKTRARDKIPHPVKAKAEKNPNTAFQVPSKITIGGRNWMAVIRFDITEVTGVDGDLQYLIFPSGTMQPSLVSLFETLPTMAGIELSNDIMQAVKYMDLVYGKKISFPDILDLATLAKAAGWNTSVCDRFHLWMYFFGDYFNEFGMLLDGHWAQEWKNLCKPFRLVLLGLSQLLFSLFTVISGTLVRDLFPDPDIMCYLFELSQEDCYVYLVDLLVHLLVNKEVCTESEDSRSRESLILSLVSSAGRPNDPKLQLLADLVPNHPCVSQGGAKFLHTARKEALRQYSIVQQISFSHTYLGPNLSRELKEPLVKLCLYGRAVNPPGLVSWEKSEYSNLEGLRADPDLAQLVLQLDVEHCTNEEFLSLGGHSAQGTSLVNAVSEWGRLNVSLIEVVMKRLVDISKEGMTDSPWFHRTVLYENLRLIYKRVMNQNTIRVPLIEDLIQKTRDRVQADSDTLVVKNSGLPVISAERQSNNRQLRADLFRNIRSEDRVASRVAQHQAVHDKVPGDNHARNLAWKQKRKERKKRKREQDGKLFIPDKVFKPMRKASFDLRQKMSKHTVTRAVQQPGESDDHVSTRAVRQPGEVDNGNATRAAKQPGQQIEDQQVEASKRYKKMLENQDWQILNQAADSDSDSEDSNKRYWSY